MLGVETAFAIANTELDADIEKLVELLSTNPARIAGIDDRHGGPIEVGRPANLALLDLDEQWTITGAALASRSSNTPSKGVRCAARFDTRSGTVTLWSRTEKRRDDNS